MIGSALFLDREIKPARNIALLLCFLFCLGFFVQRGPYRAIRYSKAYDFSTLYAAARSWTVGVDPYPAADRKDQLRQAGAPDSLIRQQDVNPCLYLISAMPLIASIAWLPWPAANVVWSLLSVGTFAASLLIIVNRTRLSPQSKWICCSLSLLFCPAYVGSLYENPSVLVCSSVALIVFLPETRYGLIGVLLGIALCIKPQIALCAVCALLIWKIWKALFIGAGLSAVCTLIAAGRASTWAQFVVWWHSQQANFAINAMPGGKSDPGPNSSWAFELLNGQTITALFVQDAHWRDAIVWIFAAVLLAAYILRRRAGNVDRNRDLVFFAAWTTTVAYHRYYDAQLFLLLWPALVELWSQQQRKFAIALGACVCLLAFPSQSLLARVTDSGGAVHSALDVLFFRHQPIAILAIALLALFWWPAACVNARIVAETKTSAPQPSESPTLSRYGRLLRLRRIASLRPTSSLSPAARPATSSHLARNVPG